MHAVSTNQITDILHFIDNFLYSLGKIIHSFGAKKEMVSVPFLGLPGFFSLGYSY